VRERQRQPEARGRTSAKTTGYCAKLTANPNPSLKAFRCWLDRSSDCSCSFSLRKSHSERISAVHSITEKCVSRDGELALPKRGVEVLYPRRAGNGLAAHEFGAIGLLNVQLGGFGNGFLGRNLERSPVALQAGLRSDVRRHPRCRVPKRKMRDTAGSLRRRQCGLP
jgi:hypothetical protein